MAASKRPQLRLPVVPPPCITLTTDFGTRDGYVGAMKGCLMTLAPGVPVVDISHDIAPQGVVEGAWCLRRAARQFPPGAIHVGVVDPEVGSWRSAIIVVTDHFVFVGPDNGLLSLAAKDDGIRRVIEIQESQGQWAKSASFDGLTLFAPVAARLAVGLELDAVGEDAEDLVALPEPQPNRVGHALIGQVLFADRFGNCMTNIHKDIAGNRAIDRIVVQPGLEAHLCSHYAELAGGAPTSDNPAGSKPEDLGMVGALWNSDGYLELALFGQSLAERLGLKTGHPIRLLFRG